MKGISMNNDNQVAGNQAEFTAGQTTIPELSPGVMAPKVDRKPELQTQQVEDLRLHPILQQFNEAMSKEERDSLSADIKYRGVMVPIQVNQFGEILDGVHRYEEAKAAGLKEVPTQVFYFMSDEDQELHIYKANIMRKKISTQHKYLTIARISKIYEKGRGGPRNKGIKVSDTFMKDVLEETGKKLGISPEVVKLARRYEKASLAYPGHEDVEPKRFLTSVVPLLSLKFEPFRSKLLTRVKDRGWNIESDFLWRIKDYDRLMAISPNKRTVTSGANYVLDCWDEKQKVDATRLANYLGITTDQFAIKSEEKKSTEDNSFEDVELDVTTVSNSEVLDQAGSITPEKNESEKSNADQNDESRFDKIVSRISTAQKKLQLNLRRLVPKSIL
jgi:hypothetical protein